ncbi:site-2 protease family protein [Candidatus Peregrinibacteria bacterium]|nr:MAG: site-2 protease family protein [Candidatus Peregrinibacteria bacterium]
MEYFITGIVFVLIFSLIILIHEGGHFWAARFGKIKVEEFGFGLPPKACGWKNKKSGVLYSLNWIPFGGFVRMLGEDDRDKKAQKDPHAFGNRPLWARIFTVCAGVMMNFLLGWILLTVGYTIGMKPILISPEDVDHAVANGIVLTDDAGVLIAKVVPNSPAEKAGLLSGDFITGIDNIVPVQTAQEFLDAKNRGLRGKEFHLQILRRTYSSTGQIETEKRIVALVPLDEEGNMGIYPSDDPSITAILPVQYAPHKAAWQAAKDVGNLSHYTVVMLGDVVSSLVSKLTVPDGVGGPVAIVKATHHFVSLGEVMEIVKFAALLSISIGVINIMPVPALDGGRLIFLLFEGIFRRKPLPKWEPIIHGVGFILLILFLIAITWKDLTSTISW